MMINYAFEQLEDKCSMEGITKQDINLICDLIKGEGISSNYSQRMEKKFLFDIVSNKKNSFDLDKLDYLNRDLKHT